MTKENPRNKQLDYVEYMFRDYIKNLRLSGEGRGTTKAQRLGIEIRRNMIELEDPYYNIHHPQEEAK